MNQMALYEDPQAMLLEIRRRRAALRERELVGLKRSLDAVSSFCLPRQKEQRLMVSLYKILGVSPTADKPELRRAYRALALRHHTDRGGSRERFEEIQAAYDTLMNDALRQAYDAKRAVWLAENQAVDCPQCATANRIADPDAAMHCAACKTPLTAETVKGRLKRRGIQALHGTTEVAQGYADGVVDETTAALHHLVRVGFDALRNKLRRK